MLIIVEVALILLLAFIYLIREKKRKIRNYRTGDIIWVRHNLFKPIKGVLCNWDEQTFTYIPDDSDELFVKRWFFLIRNDSYRQRKNNRES